MNQIKIKICCIKSLSEAELALKSGANAIGLVGKMPSGPGVIDQETIRSISEAYTGLVNTFLLTSSTKAEDILRDHQAARTSTIQLVDHVNRNELVELKQSIPEVDLIQVIHVIDENNIKEAMEIAEVVDGILLDSGNPGLKVKELGGTGRTHNWKISRAIIESVDIPVYLAGGLRHSNVADAINEVQPYGLDLCSGVRSNDRLDPEKLKSFMTKAREIII